MLMRRNLMVVIFGSLTFALILLGASGRTQPQPAIAGGDPPVAEATIANYLPMIVKADIPTPTNTPAAPPTNTPPPANVQLTLIVYNPAGDDVQGEYVRIENKGGSSAVLTGWTLSDNDSHVYNFPGGFTLAPGAAVLVWVKSGANNATNLYWGSAQAFWNNTGDVAYLRNGATVVDSCSYAGGGAQANC